MTDPYDARTRIADLLIPEERAMSRCSYIYGGSDEVLLEFLVALHARKFPNVGIEVDMAASGNILRFDLKGHGSDGER
jgi:hypothetical protein